MEPGRDGPPPFPEVPCSLHPPSRLRLWLLMQEAHGSELGGWGQLDLSYNLAPHFPSCVSLGYLLTLSEPHL